MSSGWPNKRARAYLGGDPPGLAQITAIGTGREHPFWCVFSPGRLFQPTNRNTGSVQHSEDPDAVPDPDASPRPSL
jgi:hypothetical protein